MLIRKLELRAFGPFEDRVLDFGTGACGLHIVCGPNEAGKSSALRALHALLYGVPMRTTDNFLHDNSLLRIGGVLANGEGETLAFVRRKGNKDTLLGVDGCVLKDNELDAWLGGVDAEVFASLFGIDHRALTEGGQAILAQHGDVGEALFSAASASQGLHRVLGDLDNRADEIFKPRGSKPLINHARAEHKKWQDAVRHAALSGSDWQEKYREVETTRGELTSIKSQLNDARTLLHKLKRYQRLLPRFSLRRNISADLGELAGVTELAHDFSMRRRKIENDLSVARQTLEYTQRERQRLQDKLAAIIIDEKLLNHADAIGELHATLATYRKAKSKLPASGQAQATKTAEMQTSLHQIDEGLSIDDMDRLLTVLARQPEISRLVKIYRELSGEILRHEKNRREIFRSLESLRKKFDAREAFPDTSDLRRKIQLARKAGDLDTRLQELAATLEDERLQTMQGMQSLTLWRGGSREAMKLAIPGRDTISRFRDDFTDLSHRVKNASKAREALLQELRQTKENIRLTQQGIDLPSEAQLQETRQLRDKAWTLLKRQWLDGADVSREAEELDNQYPLPRAFEERLVSADRIVDHLRSDAERVSRLEQLAEILRAGEQKLSVIDAEIETLKASAEALKKDWSTAWIDAGIEPLQPAEMLGWADKLDKLRQALGDTQSMEGEQRRLGEQRAQLIGSLADHALMDQHSAPEITLEPQLLMAEERLAALENIRRESGSLRNRLNEVSDHLDKTDAELQDAEHTRQRWFEEWRQAIAGSGLDEHADPAIAEQRLSQISQVFEKRAALQELTVSIREQKAEILAFDELYAVVDQALPTVDRESSPGQRVGAWLSSLNEQQNRLAHRDEYKRDLDDIEAKILRAEDEHRSAELSMRELLQEAHCDNPRELDEIERRAAGLRDLRKQLVDCEREILVDGEGADLATLESDIQAVDPTTIAAEIEQLEERIDQELEPQQKSLFEQSGRVQTELALMDGNDKAAEFAEQAEQQVTLMREYADEYIRLKIAAKILREEIERFRQKNQGPMLSRASAYFASLTLGSFASLDIEVDDRDQARLVALRGDGSRVFVEGMSSGTTDQLYLSLRLAALEKFIDEKHAMPFIVDDVLIEFDDQRSMAALELFAEFAQKTQVVMFTHHRRLVELAGQLRTPATIHEL